MNQPFTASLDRLEFKETPTNLVAEAIKEYEATKSNDYVAEQARTWNLLANQVIGHENLPN
jgi:hypothetical protein